MAGMDMGAMGAAPTVPAGLADAEGQEIRFIHTEVSDADITKLLSDMMGSPNPSTAIPMTTTIPRLIAAIPQPGRPIAAAASMHR